MSTPQRIPQYFYDNPDMVPAWEFLQKWVPGAWRAIGDEGSSYLNGYRHFAAGDGINSPAQWRRNGDEIEFCGLVDNNGGNFVAATNIVQMPPEMIVVGSPWVWVQTAMARGNAFTTAGTVEMKYTVGTGVLQFVGGTTAAGLANPVSYISLTGLRFPLI